MLVLGDEQVLQRRHGLEQAHVLEGAHHALSGHAVTAQAVDALAFQVDVAGRRRVETADAVEHRGLARPVGADDGKNLLGLQVQFNAVDGDQAAETHPQVVYFK